MKSGVRISPYFNLEKVTEGVWGAYVKEGTGALGNAGFVDLGNDTLIFDTFLIPDAAIDLRAAAEEITGNKVKYVVNSHWHADHIYGNQVFRDCIIISTQRTKELIGKFCKIDDVDKTALSYDEYLKSQEDRLEKEMNANIRRSLMNDLNDKKVFASKLRVIDLIIPTHTFLEKMELHGSKRTVEIISFGGGHTESDAFLFLPEEKIALTADLVPVKVHPRIGSGNVKEWLAVLERMKSLGITKLVPGHGPIGSMNDIEEASRYLTRLLGLADKIKISHPHSDNLMKYIPVEYQNWSDPHIFESNINHLLNENKEEKK